jgi:hypothetical protein
MSTMMGLLAIRRRIGNRISPRRREPNIAEILSDPVIKAVMEADGVDPDVLEVQLRDTARRLSDGL